MRVKDSIQYPRANFNVDYFTLSMESIDEAKIQKNLSLNDEDSLRLIVWIQFIKGYVVIFITSIAFMLMFLGLGLVTQGLHLILKKRNFLVKVYDKALRFVNRFEIKNIVALYRAQLIDQENFFQRLDGIQLMYNSSIDSFVDPEKSDWDVLEYVNKKHNISLNKKQP